MEAKKKIIFFIVTTVILGTITFLIIRNTEKKEMQQSNESDSTKAEAITEEINYEKYLELRSKAHDTETYAILIWNSDNEVSVEYLEEVKAAFENRKSVVYLVNIKSLSEADYSRVIDDITEVMGYKKPELIVPTILVMAKGDIVYKHAGLIYREELRDNLNAKSVE